MYKLIAHDGETVYGIKEYVVDTEAELANVPDCPMGSTVLVIENGKVFMKNSQKEWISI